jgi:hypothetical protein
MKIAEMFALRLAEELNIISIFLLLLVAFMGFCVYSIYYMLRSERQFWLETNKELQNQINSLLDRLTHL